MNEIYTTITDFVKDWRTINDWLPRDIVDAMVNGRPFEIDEDQLLMANPERKGMWFVVAIRRA